jgi:hypothetical protein
MKRLKRAYKKLQLLGLMLYFIQPLNAQVSSADSLFLNSVATEQVWISYWNYPGNWFIRSEVNSVSNFYTQAQQEFPIQTPEYANCYAGIQPANHLLNDSLINNSIDSLESNTAINLFNLPQAFRVLPFTLNGQTGYARALLDSSHNNGQHKVAYMVVLGSGTNLIKQFFDNQGYHNTNCATMNYLKTKGDVYVMTSPNEEQRAIYFNKKKMKSSIAPSFLLNYLNADNRAPGITRLIEYVAMVKYLKQEYERVIVLGLSTGGKVAHWISLMAEPDAALISSGYSVLVDNDLNSQNVNAIFYGPYQTIYTKDSLKNRLKQVKTQFLFTLPQNDAPIAQLDIDSGYTKTFYQDAGNASFFYGYTNHAFPPCNNMDTFFNRCILKPKIKIQTSISGCTKDSINLPLHFIGTAPFSFSLWHNGNAIATFNNVASDTVLRLFQAGQYWIDSLHDASPYLGYRSDTFHYNPSPPLQAQWQIQNYNCLSNSVAASLNIQGASPFSVSGIINNQTTTWQQNGNYNTFFGNGEHKQFVIQDSFSCVLSMPDSFQFNFTPIGINTLTPIYDCDSNKTKINFTLQGNGPWILNYTFNGSVQQKILTQANTDVFFTNGLYQFIDVVDSTGCMATINQSFNFQYQALSWNITQQAYDCDSNLYKTQWAFTGNGPWTLTYELIGGFLYTQTYTNSNATLYLPNGQWQMLSVSDNTGCVQAINVPFSISFTPLSVNTTPPQYDCDSNKMQVAFNVQGNAPFVFQVNQLNNNNTQWISTSQNNPSFWWNNGQYLVQQVTDATGCSKPINQYINHAIQPLAYQLLPIQYNCDSQKVRFPIHWQGNAPWIISYRNLSNGLVYTQIDSIPNSSLWLATGQYALLSLSDAYCTIALQDTLIVNFPSLNAQVTTPGILCDSNKARMELTVQAGLAPLFLHYVFNGIPDSMPITVGQQSYLLPNGSYYFNQVRDSAQCALNINKSYTANYIPLQWHPWSNQYNCLLNINDISFNISGANNTTLYYTRNGAPNTLLLNAGTNNVQWNKAQYQLAYIRDTAQCSLLIDTTFTINDEPIAFDVSDLKPICYDKVHEYTFKVKGKAPWLLSYNNENITKTISIADTMLTWICSPGNYYYQKLSDANNCTLPLTRIDTLTPFIESPPLLTTNYTNIDIEPSTYPILWYLNGLLLDSLRYNTPSIKIIQEGIYSASLLDESGCIWISDSISINFPNNITIYPNPFTNYINIAINENFGSYWQMELIDIMGKTVFTNKIETAFLHWPCTNLASGVYTLKILFQNSKKPVFQRMLKR